MKKISTILFALTLFACSCQKEVCNVGTIQVKNMGSVPVTLYSIESHPTILPGETIGQSVEFCEGFDFNGNECYDTQQTSVLFKFENGEMQSVGAVVSRCQTTEVQISN